ncbi:nuclear transcription factor Y subunit beta isoform X2 [Drosophila pseudoobscura]|uniref:Nuclear transcription factor Y subunit beta isoform X2 n=1 Tax=Drosophila pseudoobscura pseudoobscura TaxID=46245 RepID=A0A6I8UDI1_DROPS|nr:nuclear transcription factor Y subunit beta isoform X2 [Drosophila pseudoobscura]
MTRLTEEMVIARSKQSDLGLITKLNCWGSDLTDVSIIKRMRGVEVLALSVNKISTLAHFEDCSKLQELYLRKNHIQDINEIAYLQNLPALRNLWLEENPFCDQAGANYRAIVLRALPNLKKLDNVEVTQEEVDDALRRGGSVGGGGGGGGGSGSVPEDEVYEDAYEVRQQQRTSPQHSYPTHSPPPQQQQQYHPQTQQQPQQQPQQQRQSSSPIMREPLLLASPPGNHSCEGTITHSASDLGGSQVLPVHGSKPPTPTKEPVHPPSPMYNTLTKEQRTSYQQYDRSPGSDQESSPNAGYREVRPAPIPPSISAHSMKEYYQSDRPTYPAHYRHSQTDLTEWEEHQQHQVPQVHHNPYGSQMLNHPQRRSVGPESGDRFTGYRNGSARENGGDWDPEDRPRSRRPEGRYSDSTNNVSASVANHYSGYHRRPINRSSNLLSATLCLVKELDYASLEVLEHAVRCRIDELATE